MAVGAEVQSTASARLGGEYLARASHFSRQSKIDDFVFPALFARRTKACLEAYDYTWEDLGILSEKAYGNANKNPLAHMRAVSMDKAFAATPSDKNPCFLGNDEYKDYLKVSDCSQVSDGASALILVSEAGLAQLGKTEADAVEVVGLGHATGNLYTDADPLEMPTTARAAQNAYQQAGLKASDVDVVELHDCFTVTELLMYEALGFAEKGKGGQFARSGATQLDGALPVNTGGGLVGFGHPVGATGIKQVLEIYRQMKGQCGDYQMTAKTPEVGICSNMGGDDKTAVVTLIKNC